MTIPWNFNRFYSWEEWEKIIEDWEKSRLTKRAYCKKQQLVYRTFCEWENKLHPSTTLTRQEIEERWRKIVKNWEKSGLSQYAYCNEKGLNKSVFWQWERKFNLHNLRKSAHMMAVEKWTSIVADWKKSGLKKSAYCKKHRLTYSYLCKWAKHLASPEPSQSQENLIEKPCIVIEKPCIETPFDSSFPRSVLLKGSEQSNQKIEVILSQGERFYLEGLFDWPKLTTWLTPLLTR